MFATQLAQQLDADGFEIMDFRPSFTNFTPACVELESACADRRVFHNQNPVLRWNMDCVRVKQHTEGGIRPVKPDRLKSRKRIDGIVAAIMDLGRALLRPDPDDDGPLIWVDTS